MKTMLKPQGQKFVIELDKAVLEQLNIDPEKPVEVVLYPADDDLDKAVKKSLAYMDEKYAAALKKLAE